MSLKTLWYKLIGKPSHPHYCCECEHYRLDEYWVNAEEKCRDRLALVTELGDTDEANALTLRIRQIQENAAEFSKCAAYTKTKYKRNNFRLRR